MTKQEALKELMDLSIDYGTMTAEEIERLDEAVDMAIAALRADAVDRLTCEDAVSRQQAIDAVGYYSLHSGDKLLFADKPLKDLPSVQPQPEIIRCKDCRYYKTYDYTGYLACHLVVGGTVIRDLDDFCSRAERRTDE